jgi:hypothetical protein|tara:strand:- start:1786 stop:2049 length:264 start_codon:yes stop_codon:yes gene_type:complete
MAWDAGMRYFLLMIALVVFGGASPPKETTPKTTTGKPKPPNIVTKKLIVEKTIRKKLNKPTGGFGEGNGAGSQWQATDRRGWRSSRS